MLGHQLIKKIDFNNGVVAILEKPILKSEVLLHKDEILSNLSKRGLKVKTLL